MFEFSTMLSFAIPGTVIGVSYNLAFNFPPIEPTGTSIAIAYSATCRAVSMVFQSYVLFPHMTVQQDVAYGLAVKALPKTTAVAGLMKAWKW